MATGNRGWAGDIYIPRNVEITPGLLKAIYEAAELLDRDRRERAERRKIRKEQRKRKPDDGKK
jgi:hypothetical protein